jgi:ribosomal protein S18 acetylase RimI-like enzyme
MFSSVRAATERDAERLWLAVRSDGPHKTREAHMSAYLAQPWSVRVAGRGQAAILGRWKGHLDVLAMRRVWASPRVVPAFVTDAREVAAEHGFGRLLSPLLPEMLLVPYLRAGMRVAERVVALQADPGFVSVGSAGSASIRQGTPEDLSAVAAIDAEGFGDFWRWGEPDLLGMLAEERLAVAEDGCGAIIGYTLATLDRGTATLTRLAVLPGARRQGVGTALLGESAAWAAARGARTISLCTQVNNVASRALYRSSGFVELEHVYAFAIEDVAREAER